MRMCEEKREEGLGRRLGVKTTASGCNKDYDPARETGKKQSDKNSQVSSVTKT